MACSFQRFVAAVTVVMSLGLGGCSTRSDVGGDASADATGGDATVDAAACVPGERPCREGSYCLAGQCVSTCGDRTPCEDVCCDTAQQCLAGICVASCDDSARLCGKDRDSCCSPDQACVRDACTDLGDPCEFSYTCPPGNYCAPDLGRCLPRDGTGTCEYRPPVGEFTPRTACQWRPLRSETWWAHDDVVMTPAVANLSDDNGDGKTDRQDIPDIVFTSFDKQTDGCCTPKGVIRVVSGRCNEDGTMTTLATIGKQSPSDDTLPWIDNSGGVALGNLDPDTDASEKAPEIVATVQPAHGGGVIAFKRTADDGTAWELHWWNRDHLKKPQASAGAQPSIADLNHDGKPEVIVGNVVLNGQTGETIWDGWKTASSTAGVGNNAFLGPTSTVADLDLDGIPEVIAGNTVYESWTEADGWSGKAKWTYTFSGNGSTCAGGAVRCDGYTAVGDFDADPQGEVVIVRRGQIVVLNHDKSVLHGPINLPKDDCDDNEGGPPTIADFDGDGRPEIGVAGADFYVVFDFDCKGSPLPTGCEAQNVLWKVPNHDCSSRATGSSVFDFEGDGKAEVIYADETNFRIFDGTTGAILFDDDTHSSNTRMEMPLVVDVDNDGKSEVVVPEPNTGSEERGGIEIWEDADNNWVRTRRVWNQHTYHVTNITEDGQIPRLEEANWQNSRLNNFRQNVQPDDLFDAPDFVVDGIDGVLCGKDPGVRFTVTVANQGDLGAAPGVPVLITATANDGLQFKQVVRTVTYLLPGQSEVLALVWEMDELHEGMLKITAKADDDGNGNATYNECREDNNDLTWERSLSCSGPY